jgi:hypothetical protein
VADRGTRAALAPRKEGHSDLPQRQKRKTRKVCVMRTDSKLKKLCLKRETVRVLQADELQGVHGGNATLPTITEKISKLICPTRQCTILPTCLAV